MAKHGRSYDVIAEDVDGVVSLAQQISADLVVVGPEAPLVLGLVDRLNDLGIAAFGPTASAAQIEGSKSWANDLMYRNGIPCPQSRTFDDVSQAVAYVESQPQGEIVVKADGLAAGKGVSIPGTHSEAIEAITSSIERNEFGSAGETVVVEERLIGPELSVFAFVDGDYVATPVAARDYKRAYDGDIGPNTGGMGAYTSPGLCPQVELEDIKKRILEPTARAMVREGCDYRGVLYAGLMLTDTGPQVIEFNCRFGDPECEPLMLRLEPDLAELCLATATGELPNFDTTWNNRRAVSVVIVSGDYPRAYETGYEIDGTLPYDDDGIVFHAGTKQKEDSNLVTDGGRVLVATASSDDSVAAARDNAYQIASGITFTDSRYRSDIAADAD